MNGKEKDNETELLNYGFRMYDARLGRFISVDPVARQFPFFSPYQYAGNKPIWATDLDGLETNYTNVIDPVPSEKPLYARRAHGDPHTESLPVGTQNVDWKYSTQQDFYFTDGNIKYKDIGVLRVYFEQTSPVCKVTNYKTILVDQNLVTPGEKAEYKVIDKETRKALHSATPGAKTTASDVANTAATLVGFRLNDVANDNGKPKSINFNVKDNTNPFINAVKLNLEKSTGLPVNVTQDNTQVSDFTYSVNYEKSILKKAATPATTTTTQVEQTVPNGESYVPCPSGGTTGGTNSGTTEKKP